MEKKNITLRLTALLCVFVFVFSMIMSGCVSVKKVVKKASANADDSGVITVGSDDSSSQDKSQIVIDSNGKTVVNNSTIANNSNGGGSTPTGGTNATTYSNKTTAKVTTTKAAATTSSVYNALAAQRKFGFNKYFDKYSGLANFYLDTIRVYFTYGGKDWLVEFWKGEYAMASVGCEIGYYNRKSDGKVNTVGADNLLYGAIEDDEAMMTSMELWQYKKKDDEKPTYLFNYGERNCWWAAQFSTGVLYRHSDRTSLIMKGTVKFPNETMTKLFVEQIEKKGFKNGSISTYNDYEKYSVNGTKVTVMWKNFDEDRG